MQNLFLTFYQRVLLAQNIGAATVNTIREAGVFLRLLEKIRLTDEEVTRSQFLQDGPRVTWQLPQANYGSRDIDLEQDEMQALTRTIEQAQGVRVADVEWMLRLIEEPKEVEMSPAAESQKRSRVEK